MADIQFFINGHLHTVADPAATTTVLDYLREQAGLTGTKEGCAEGDCGACTTVLCELDGPERLQLRAINACIQFLPTLDGKELLTVEGLAAADGSLHPVQQALVDQHGSQCGFCTPGFAMALFALFRDNPAPDQTAVRAALAGNLCRCTGYRPIIDAALTMAGQPRADHWTHHPAETERHPGEAAMLRRLQGIQREQSLDLPDGFLAPRTCAELDQMLADHPDATLLAGGTDIGLWVTKDHRDLGTVISLGAVAELQSITDAGDHLQIGAGVSLTRAFDRLVAWYPGLAELARRFASPPICNAGTLVGNIANGSPIGDSMPALMCLGAELVLRSVAGERTMDLDSFYTGYRQTALAAGEYVAAVRVPAPRPGLELRAYKVAKRRDQDISAVLGAFAVQVEDGVVQQVACCYGGVAATPARASQAEQALRGQPWSEATVRTAMAVLAQDFQPIGDMRASADYRMQAAGQLLLTFWQDCTGGDNPVRVFELGSLSA